MSEPQPVTSSVEATGFATITGGNIAIARDGATQDALRKAVEQAVGSYVSSETMVENYQTLSDSVYTKTGGYIKGYSIIKESQLGGLYQVTVRADVAMGSLKDDLGALGLLYARVEKPRVLFMIAEKNIGRRYYSFWWWGRSEYMGETVDISAAETTLKEIFLNQGFNVVDVSGTADTIEISNAFRVEDLTNEGARKIGKKLNAEVVVYGKALAAAGPRTPGSSVGSYIADITAQAVRVDDGIVLGSGKGHGASRHISDVTGGVEAISKASSELAGKLIGQIAAKWQGGSQPVTLTITGVDDYKKIADLKNTLKSRIRGVKAVYQRAFEAGTVVFELDSKLSAQNIADELQRLGLPIRVTRTSANTIEAVMESQ